MASIGDFPDHSTAFTPIEGTRMRARMTNRLRHQAITRLDGALRLRSHKLAARYLSALGRGPVLDVGCGTGHTAELLTQLGHRVITLDVEDLSVFHRVRPILYDGESMPFKEGAFDTAILQTTLHHCHKPDVVLAEAARVATTLVVVEDVIQGPLHRLVTFGVDSALNLEFVGHPHSNKTDGAWRSLFESMGLRIETSSLQIRYGVIRQMTYVLHRN